MGRAFYHPIEPSKVTKTTGMAPARTERDGFDVSIEEVPVTVQRRPFIPRRGDEMLKDPGTPRANIAASVEEPNGTQKGDWARGINIKQSSNNTSPTSIPTPTA